MAPGRVRTCRRHGTLKSHESAAGFAAFGKGDFTLLTSQYRDGFHGSPATR